MCPAVPPGPSPRLGAASAQQALERLRSKTGLPWLVTLPSHVHSEPAPSFPSLSLPGFGQRSSGTSAKTSVWEGGKETLETSFSTVSTQCFSTLSSPRPPHSPPPPQVHKTAGAFYSKLPQLPDAHPHICADLPDPPSGPTARWEDGGGSSLPLVKPPPYATIAHSPVLYSGSLML